MGLCRTICGRPCPGHDPAGTPAAAPQESGDNRQSLPRVLEQRRRPVRLPALDGRNIPVAVQKAAKAAPASGVPVGHIISEATLRPVQPQPIRPTMNDIEIRLACLSLACDSLRHEPFDNIFVLAERIVAMAERIEQYIRTGDDAKPAPVKPAAPPPDPPPTPEWIKGVCRYLEMEARRLGLTPTEMWAQIGCNANSYLGWSAGRCRPNPSNWMRLLRAVREGLKPPSVVPKSKRPVATAAPEALPGSDLLDDPKGTA